MDDARYVPIWTVANFNQIKRLTSDLKLITEVLKGMLQLFRQTNVVGTADAYLHTGAAHEVYTYIHTCILCIILGIVT